MRLFGHNITRRGAMRATAAGVATTAAVGLLAGCQHTDDETSDPVVVDESSADDILSEEGGYTEVDLPLEELHRWTMPLGTILRSAEGSWACALTPGSTALPALKAIAISTDTGAYHDILTDLRMGVDPNTCLFDARCSDKVLAWVEMDYLKRNWTLYAQQFAQGDPWGGAVELWNGDADWDPPYFAVTDDMVVWQVMPSLSGTKTTEMSHAYLWHLGESAARAVVRSPGRFPTPPAVSDGTITLCPRVNADKGVYYGIRAYDLDDDMASIVDQIVMPQGVRPFRAVRMGKRFAFSVEANYASGGLLGSMGTYFGTGTGPFITLAREPAAQIAGTDELCIVKCRASYFVIDTEREEFSILTAANRCVDYGEFPASEGVCENFLTFATVKDQDVGYPSAVIVRSFALQTRATKSSQDVQY
jgi:hypothetical protein